MNNDQFRKLVFANSAEPSSSKNGPPPTASPSGGGALGSRQRASIPMTPRAVAGAQADFARQLAERNQAAHAQKKKYKTSAPKGVKLAPGYVDRAQQRQDDAADDREQRLKTLEESLKKEEIDRETYDKHRFEIAGGSLDSTHLVKGLDFKLLERVRRGEDVYGNKQKGPAKDDEPDGDDKGDDEPDEPDEPDGDNVDDVDDAFDELEGREVQALEKEKTERKKGQLSTVSLTPGKKRTRDQILAELKAAREAAKAQKMSSLGSRFKKIGTTQKPGTRIERDSKGREVLVIVDEDGHEKRKVRKLRPGEEEGNGLLMPNPDAKPLGMDVPEQYKQVREPEQDKDFDIFDGVGDDYDPLAGMDASDSDSDDEKAQAEKGDAEPPGEGVEKARKTGATDAELMPPPPRPAAARAPRNYFKDSKTGLLSMEEAKGPSMSDPDIMAAIKRAAALHPVESEEDALAKEEAKAMEERQKKLLRMSDRDDEDIDMGFGTSRFEDEEDFDESKVKLSTWGGGGGEDGGQGKRKRGPKKRKGDVNSAADVLRVMEQRKRS
ncbi:hypothetical protein TOPH_05859 [Tolypocladium ophioglossoides CBS 100239]|uniref:RED-like N-terminal domain-containing protein n=1 Tax=Tolypocladium ophioglossoides (strain CBS 100239) TaxID=1163406 RepID=A0A0L0N5X0_TOLOC|nr:hypothetical protein TOPH_05859 [Tolypocladium ophioglossoides CBS 100239]